jgi:hypothetical protein
MYLMGQGHEHQGPGTSLVQRIDWTAANEAQLVAGRTGLGCGGNCGCKECRGLGLFESGTDFRGWGWQEYLAVGLGGYILTSMVFTGKRAVGSARAGMRRGRQRLGKKIAGK